MQSEVQCMQCGHRSCKVEPFLDISLSLDFVQSQTQTEFNPPTAPGVGQGLPPIGTSPFCDENPEEKEGYKDSEGEGGDTSESPFPSPSPSPLPPTRRSSRGNLPVSLADCLEHYTSAEMLSEQVLM